MSGYADRHSKGPSYDLRIQIGMTGFLSRVIPEPNSGCWLWMGCSTKEGYGKFFCNASRKFYLASRWILECHNREHLGWLCACHRCDNPFCVNPQHLFKGTYSDNSQDALKKGRLKIPFGVKYFGSSNHATRLTQAEIDEIRKRASQGEGQSKLAIEYRVSQSLISRIKSGHRKTPGVGLTDEVGR